MAIGKLGEACRPAFSFSTSFGNAQFWTVHVVSPAILLHLVGQLGSFEPGASSHAHHGRCGLRNAAARLLWSLPLSSDEVVNPVMMGFVRELHVLLVAE